MTDLNDLVTAAYSATCEKHGERHNKLLGCMGCNAERLRRWREWGGR